MSEPTFKIYSGPDFRGTYDLVFSCITTLFLCVWTAVHLDIPTPAFKGSPQLVRKAKWLTLGMLAPELLLFTACLQYWSARSIQREADKLDSRTGSRLRRVWRWIRKQLCRLHGCLASRTPLWSRLNGNEDEEKLEFEPDSDFSSREHQWTLVHSFYACMGGFAFDAGRQQDSFLPDNQTRAVLTPAGIKFLMKYAPEVIPDVSEEDISDKSKASGLAKLLVCLQAIWFCIQFFARIPQGLSFSVLELNTAAHAVCALTSYYLWWSKPLDVGEPTLISCEADHAERWNARQTCAFMYVLGEAASGSGDSEDAIKRLYRVLMSTDFEYSSSSFEPLVSRSSSDSGDPSLQPYSQGIEHRSSPGPNSSSRCKPTQFARRWFEHRLSSDPDDSTNDSSSSHLLHHHKVQHHSPSNTDVSNESSFRRNMTMMTLAHQWVQLHPKFEWKAEGSSLPVTRDFGGDYNHALLIVQSKLDMDNLMGLRWQDIAMLFRDQFILLRSVCFCFIAAVYGGVHASAWNLPFPTIIERTIWRYSAVLVALSALFSPLARRFLQTKFCEARQDKKIWKFIIYGLTLVLTIPYSLARTYIVVESLRQVFYLPPEVFQEPDLTKYLPHFS
ncbi:hypothetical protein K435DRAFT_796443 [Dendrothele bispora CBS 962.96]|uniref:Uncharacterized protein n=1 Tax=Dendrothele bispora (strain CBS 962.96) TaxID=1314807 RepID=A0A4S8M5J0_DENBC|nr:hypothetical protein K435DRAFT_796443 [Dendrothele bispora CBS 962.96]